MNAIPSKDEVYSRCENHGRLVYAALDGARKPCRKSDPRIDVQRAVRA
jgi:hypothetical protein